MHGAAIVLLFLLPWLDRNDVKSIRYRSGAYKLWLALFVISFVMLGWLGMEEVNTRNTWLARGFSFIYFAFFLAIFVISKNEKTKPVPEKVTG